MTVPENNMEILIFPSLHEDSTQNINSYLNQVNALVKKYSDDYLWHEDKLIFSNNSINLHSDTIDYKKGEDLLRKEYGVFFDVIIIYWVY